MNPNLKRILSETTRVMKKPRDCDYRGPVHVGVDLGTVYSVLIVLDANYRPLAGAYRYAEVVREGLVVDFHGAIRLVREMKSKVEGCLGFRLKSAATAYPPGVRLAEVKATGHVIEAADMECSGFVDEPTAANAVLQISDGAIVDVGGGTTGIAVFRDGKVIFTADEPTGGRQFSLVIAGGLGISFEEAEKRKIDPHWQQQLFPMVVPVMQKVGTIVRRYIAPYNIDTIYLVGGTCLFPGIDEVIQDVVGVRTLIPGYPLFVTPLGVAMHN